MARNGSGTYSIPNTLVAGTIITAAGHNQNYSDIATEITNSVAVDGQSTLTGQLKLANGTVSAPAWTFGSDTDSGLYRIGANNIGAAVNGAKVLDIGTAGLAITGTLSATGTVTLTDGGDIASAAALTLGSGNFFNITGTTTTTSIATKGVGTVVKLRAAAAWPITHHATNLILLSGASITCAAGDMMEFEEYGTGTWRMTSFQRADGTPLVVPTATQAQQETGTSTSVYVTPGRQHFHPAHAKAFAHVVWNGSAYSLGNSHNVSGVVRDGTGQVTVSFTTGFSGQYAVFGTAETAGSKVSVTTGKGSGSVQCDLRNSSESSTDLSFNIVAFGDFS